ncbi:MAG: hypothetical protein ACRDJL_01425 [Actinomycetota bacterium]
MVANIDIAPTVMDAAGVGPSGPAFDGESLLSSTPRSRLLLEYWTDPVAPRIPTWASTLTKDQQYTEYYRSDGTRRFRELYDLDSDPHQLLNRLGDGDRSNDPSPQRLDSLSRRLEKDRSCVAQSCP